MIGDVPNGQSLMSFPGCTRNIYINKLVFKITSGEVEKKGPFFFSFFRLRRNKDAQHFFPRAAKSVARPKSRVALRATSLAAAVAQNGYFDAKVAPAQQPNSQLMPWCIGRG